MKILSIIYYTVKRNFRDYKSLSSMLLFPIILILILGTALKTLYAPPKLDRIPVAYINKDKGEMSKYFNDYLEMKEIKSLVDTRKMDSLEEAEKLLKDRSIRGIIQIDEDYSDKVLKGEKVTINVYSREFGNLKASMLQNIVDGFIKGGNATSAILKSGSRDTVFKSREFIKDKPISMEGTIPRAIDYYAVTMLVMTLMYGAIYGCYSIGEEFFRDIGKRIRVSPLRLYENLIGKILGTVVSIFIQAMILIAFTKYVYNTNWGNNMPMIIFTAFSLAVLSTSIGAAASMLSRDPDRGQGLLDVIIPIMTFISGGYSKINASEAFDKIRYLIPNQLGHNAFFNIIYGGSSLSLQGVIISMWILTLALFGIAIIAGRRVIK